MKELVEQNDVDSHLRIIYIRIDGVVQNPVQMWYQSGQISYIDVNDHFNIGWSECGVVTYVRHDDNYIDLYDNCTPRIICYKHVTAEYLPNGLLYCIKHTRHSPRKTRITTQLYGIRGYTKITPIPD